MFYNFLMIQFFIVIGNKRVNDFWVGNFKKDEELYMDSLVEKRKNFIIQKYKEGRFRKIFLVFFIKEELNKVFNKIDMDFNVFLNMFEGF